MKTLLSPTTLIGLALTAGVGAVESPLIAGDDAPEILTLPLAFEKKLANEGHGFVSLFEYVTPSRIMYEGREHTIVGPTIEGDVPVGYGFIYFAGQPQGVLDREVLFLVAGYDGSEPRWFVDANNNLDLTDDAPAVQPEADGAYLLTLNAAGRPEHRFTVRLRSFRDEPTVKKDPAIPGRFAQMLKGHTTRMGGVVAEARHWFTDRRLNVMSASTRVGDAAFQIGLYDADCNGTYADVGEDMVLTGDFESEYLSRSKSGGAAILGDETLVQLGDQTFQVVEVDPAGQFIRIAASDKPYTRLRNGAEMPRFELTLFNGTTAELTSFVSPGKFLLIDFWGHWCGGCIEALPVLAQIDTGLKENVTLLGVHSGDHDEARKIIEREQLGWVQAEVSDALTDAFLVDKWPYYVLVDDKGRILELDTSVASALRIVEAMENTSEGE